MLRYCPKAQWIILLLTIIVNSVSMVNIGNASYHSITHKGILEILKTLNLLNRYPEIFLNDNCYLIDDIIVHKIEDFKISIIVKINDSRQRSCSRDNSKLNPDYQPSHSDNISSTTKAIPIPGNILWLSLVYLVMDNRRVSIDDYLSSVPDRISSRPSAADNLRTDDVIVSLWLNDWSWSITSHLTIPKDVKISIEIKKWFPLRWRQWFSQPWNESQKKKKKGKKSHMSSDSLLRECCENLIKLNVIKFYICQ